MSQLSRICLAAIMLTAATIFAVLEPCGAAVSPGGDCVVVEQRIDEAVSELSRELERLKRSPSVAPAGPRAPLISPAQFEEAAPFTYDASLPAPHVLADGAEAGGAETSAPPPPRSANGANIPATPAMQQASQVVADSDNGPEILEAADLTPVNEQVAAAVEQSDEPVSEVGVSDSPAEVVAADEADSAPQPSTVLATAPKKASRPAQREFNGDPLQQVVNIDFREMELSNVVALLAQKAQINVIAGSDLAGVVTANLRNVTLQSAMDTVLRMNGLGMVPEAGVYHIVPYAQAVAAKRVTAMVRLENAKAADIRKTLQDVLIGSIDATLCSISTNETTNVLILAGPEARVEELKALAAALDISKPVTPTVTEALKINNAEPGELARMVDGMLTPDLGTVAVDARSRHLVVTDIPIVIEQVRALLEKVDLPVRQVSIDTMIVDAVLTDEAQTGVDWFFETFDRGRIQRLGLEADATGNPVTPNEIGPVPLAGRLFFSVLGSELNVRGVIGAEVRAQKAHLLANPVISTVENKMARIMITQEIPYQEFTQGLSGPPVATTAFKDIGIVLEVTPRVTHDDHVIAELNVKQSDTKGQINNIPIEDKRETFTTLRTRDGETVFIGGLRRVDDENTTRRIPILGDIPVVNVLFKSNIIRKGSTELLVFMTCNILPDELPPLTYEMEEAVRGIDRQPKVPDAVGELGHQILRPKIPYDDPHWKWRRAN